MIRSFADRGTRDVFDGENTKHARRTCPRTIWSVARRKLDMLHYADELSDLASPPGNRLESLAGDRRGYESIRINDQYRICFRWTPNGPEEVEIIDYHG
jgi:proteic killer suppression protein